MTNPRVRLARRGQLWWVPGANRARIPRNGMTSRSPPVARTVVEVLAAVAMVLLGVWGVVNLSEGDWFIGGVLVASAVIGFWSRAIRLLQARRRGPRGPLPPVNKPAG